ncbi:MAG TPA: RnfH family protein [Burkholderiales bacterium]|nr:RnfH family protein [Burkholderiales bacterium]
MGRIRVEVVYARPEAADCVVLTLPARATAADAVRASGIVARHAELRPEALLLGVFGKKVGPGEVLRHGDRVELYRPLKLDPKEARRRRARGGR